MNKFDVVEKINSVDLITAFLKKANKKKQNFSLMIK